MATIQVDKTSSFDTDGYILRNAINNLSSYKNIAISDNNSKALSSCYQLFNNKSNLVNFDATGLGFASSCSIRYMFNNCINLQKATNLNFQNVGAADNAFRNCSNLNNIDGTKFGVVEQAGNMFYRCNNLTEMPPMTPERAPNMFRSFEATTLNITNINFSLLMYGAYMFVTPGNVLTTQDPFIINAPNLENMSHIFNTNNKSTFPNMDINIPNCVDISYSFHKADIVNIKNFIADNVTSGSYAFSDSTCTSIDNMYMPNLEYSNGMFVGCSKLTTFNNCNLGSPINASTMFSYCYNLQNLPLINTDRIENAVGMFRNCSNLISINNNMTFSDLKCGHEMFLGCRKLNILPNIDYPNIDGACPSMFYGCNNLPNLPNFDTSNKSSLAYWFSGINSIVGDGVINNIFIDLKDKSLKATNFYNLMTGSNEFYISNAMNNAGMTFSNIDFSNGIDFSGAFSGLNTRYTDTFFTDMEINNINFFRAQNMYQTFVMQNFLTSISINLPNAINCTEMFSSCSNLISVNISTGNSLNSIGGMFSGCSNLKEIPVMNLSNCDSLWEVFRGCNNLSNESIQNIINSCLNAPNVTYKNLSNTNWYSPLRDTKFDNSYYQNRWSELDAAGWTY